MKTMDKDTHHINGICCDVHNLSLIHIYIDYLAEVIQTVASMKRGIVRNTYLYSFSADYVVSSNGCGSVSHFADSMWMKTYYATGAQMYIIPRKVYSQEYDTIYLCRQVVQQLSLIHIYRYAAFPGWQSRRVPCCK